ncbi:MAG: rRNA maturation RNase YbeY [Patescibacteria group bacterium]|nr:rRNA maturation RNase YbeY [Patescibacteria group bacterium]
MDNIKVSIFVESRYKVSRKRITRSVKKLLKENNVLGPAEVSVAIVGDRKMKSLNKKYKGKDKTTNVLSFCLSEGESSTMPTDVLWLGDVVVSYPEVIKEASKEEKMVDDKIEELVNHGVLHLLGIHHEE